MSFRPWSWVCNYLELPKEVSHIERCAQFWLGWNKLIEECKFSKFKDMSITYKVEEFENELPRIFKFLGKKLPNTIPELPKGANSGSKTHSWETCVKHINRDTVNNICIMREYYGYSGY
jgi:hypothetical protein